MSQSNKRSPVVVIVLKDKCEREQYYACASMHLRASKDRPVHIVVDDIEITYTRRVVG